MSAPGSAARHRLAARRAAPVPVPAVARDPDIVAPFLSDAAHVPGGSAAGVVFPTNVDEVVATVRSAARVLAVGAQSSLTGGATPRGDVVLSTRALDAIGVPASGRIRVGAGVSLASLQQALRAHGLYYPPVPTFEGACVGGTIATNAAGAATFKYGATRAWVDALTVVLASGDVLDLVRGATVADPGGRIEVLATDGSLITVQVPTYRLPAVPKVSAGYFSAPGLDLIDLFIGSEGTLGVIVDATLRVVPRPRTCVVVITCASENHAVGLTGALRTAALRGALDVAAIEYIDDHSLSLLDRETFEKVGLSVPSAGSTLLIAQIEVSDDADASIESLGALLDAQGAPADPVVAMPEDERGRGRIFELREAVPATVNRLVAQAKAQVDTGIQKTAGDMIVPFDRLQASLALYRRAFESRGLRYAVWGHASDGNLHPNVIPTSLDDVARGREALEEIADGVIALGGAPLAEHGVGRSPLKQSFVRRLYGDRGVDEMRAIKRALDPASRLAPGVLFPIAS